jgi:hypothetical protein
MQLIYDKWILIKLFTNYGVTLPHIKALITMFGLIWSVSFGFLLTLYYAGNIEFISTPKGIIVLVLIFLLPISILSIYSQTWHVRSLSETKLKIEELVGNRVILNNGDSIYETVARDIKEAKSSIKMLTTLKYDKTFKESRKRNEFYEALLEASKKKFHFERILQLEPQDLENWHDYMGKEVNERFLNEITASQSVGATEIKVTKIHLDMSFTIIDDEKIFFNLFSNSDDKNINDDKTSLSFYITSRENGLKALLDTFIAISKCARTISSGDVGILTKVDRDNT